MAKGRLQRIGAIVGGATLTGLLSYVVKRALGAWGVLDPLSDAIGQWLKVHVSAAAAGWTLAVIIVLVVEGVILWLMWSRLHARSGPNDQDPSTLGPPRKRNRIVVSVETSAAPPVGTFWILHLYPSPTEWACGLAKMEHYKPPSCDGIPYRFPYRCDVINYGDETLIDVHIIAKLVFGKSIKVTTVDEVITSLFVGDVTQERPCDLSLPRVDPGDSGKVSFYVENSSDLCVQVLFPSLVKATPVVSDEVEEIELRQVGAKYMYMHGRNG